MRVAIWTGININWSKRTGRPAIGHHLPRDSKFSFQQVGLE